MLESETLSLELTDHFLVKSSRDVYVKDNRVFKLEKPNPRILSCQNKIEADFFRLVKKTLYSSWVPEVYYLSQDYSVLEIEYIPNEITNEEFEDLKLKAFFMYCLDTGLLEEDVFKKSLWRKNHFIKLVDAGCLEWDIVCGKKSYFGSL